MKYFDRFIYSPYTTSTIIYINISSSQIYVFRITQGGSGDSYLLVEVRAPREYSVGFDIFCVETNADKPFDKKSSGAFR